MKRILWLATADARGHLMRCQLLVHALRARGTAVEVITTSEEGRAFLAAFGIQADLLSSHYRVEFDARQNMQRFSTEWRVFRYFVSPLRFRRDLRRLGELARGADLIVNDSFHPALLVARLFASGRELPPCVHVYGANLRRAFEDNFVRRVPSPLARFFRAKMAGFTDSAFARIEHSLSAPAGGVEKAPNTFCLPPVVALPQSQSRPRRSRLAVVYLNPHFRDPAVADAIERGLRAAGYAIHAVGEGYATRPGWRSYDPALADAIAAADLFVSAPGLGALAQARALALPFLAICTDQPEQRANLNAIADLHHACVDLGGERFELQFRNAIAWLSQARRLARAKPLESALATWVSLIESFMQKTEEGACTAA